MQTLYDIGEKIVIPLEGHVRAIEITEDGEKYSIEIDTPFRGDFYTIGTNRIIMSKEEAIKANIKRG